MNAKRAFASCATAFICMLMPFSAFAEETELFESANGYEQLEESDLSRDEGLIKSRSLTVSNDSDTVFITTTTTSLGAMQKIGVIDIEIQQSANGVNGWSVYTTVSDKTNSGVSYHYLDHYGVDVATGYYYRVKLTHYAKNYSSTTQSATVTSGIMRVY